MNVQNQENPTMCWLLNSPSKALAIPSVLSNYEAIAMASSLVSLMRGALADGNKLQFACSLVCATSQVRVAQWAKS